MINFAYIARDRQGGITRGKIMALDRSAAIASITSQGLMPLLVREPQTGKGLNINLNLKFLSSGKIKAVDKVVFSRQLSTMINAGVPIAQSLAVLAQQSDSPKMGAVAADVAKKVEGGSTLAKALNDHPTVFPSVYVNMVKAGESGGILDQVLDRLATQQEKDAEIVSKVRGAMIYPGVITTVTLGAFIFLMTVIVPKLSVVFASLGGKLPPYTVFMLALSKALTHYGLFIVIGLVGVFSLLRRLVKTPRGKHLWDSLLLRLPVLGKIIVKVNVARFARTFGSLMSAGLGIVDSLTITASALNNSVFRDELMRVAANVKNGKSMAASLKGSKHFPAIVMQMSAIGEETGQVDAVLLKIADFYEKEVDSVIAGLTSVIEPVLMIVLGVMVGAVVLSVFGPIASINEQIKG